MQLRLLHNNDMLDWIPVSLHKGLPVWKAIYSDCTQHKLPDGDFR